MSDDNLINLTIEGIPSVGVKPYKASYKQRVEDFMNNNSNLPVFVKIKNIEQLEQEDIQEEERILWKELGTEEECMNYLQNNKMSFNKNVAAFIRSHIGID